MVKVEFVFHPGFFENLSTTKKLEEMEQNMMSENTVEESKQDSSEDFKPFIPIPDIISTDNTISIENQDPFQKEFDELSMKVASQRIKFERLKSQYSYTINQAILAQDDKLNHLLKIKLQKDQISSISKPTNCQSEYSDLVNCIKTYKNSENLNRDSMSNAGYMFQKLCMHERAYYKACTLDKPIDFTCKRSGLGVQFNNKII